MPQTLTAYRPMPRQHLITKEGYPFIALALLFVFLSALQGTLLFTLIGAGLAIGIALFFRNPERVIPQGEGLIVAPADGRVLAVDRVEETPLLGGPSQRVSIFLSIFNVHINRTPIEGRVARLSYIPGKFLVASFEKASEKNERNIIHFQTSRGDNIVMSQVAGLVARRIVCYLREGMEVGRGDRLGLIRFGSRVDLYLPLACRVQIKPGENIRGGSSVIGELTS